METAILIAASPCLVLPERERSIINSNLYSRRPGVNFQTRIAFMFATVFIVGMFAGHINFSNFMAIVVSCTFSYLHHACAHIYIYVYIHVCVLVMQFSWRQAMKSPC